MPAGRMSDTQNMTSLASSGKPRTLLFAVAVMTATVGCDRTPTVTPVAPATFDEKVSWILRLENQRVLRDPQETPLATDPTAEGRPESTEVATSIASEPDLVQLLTDPEPQLRRRAALAIGRVGQPEGVGPLVGALDDPQVEVRQMSAFALGVLADPTATPALVEALDDPALVVQGRAAEALGRIGAVQSAGAIGRLVQRHVTSAFDIDPEDISYPQSPEAETFRLALYALAELGAYEPMAAAVLQDDGQPILWWWPVAYALQRTGDPRTLSALTTLAGVQGSVGVSFAAQGIGALGDPAGLDALVQLLDLERRDDSVIATAIRALALIDDPRSGAELYRLAVTRDLSPTLRLEALEALAQQPATGDTQLFVELMTDRWAPLRAAALKALARTDAETFLLVLSGLDPDPDWHVRVALAEGLAYVEPEAAVYQLTLLLGDEDARVVPAVLRSLVVQQGTDVAALLIDHLGYQDVVVRKTAAVLLGQLGRSDSAVIAALEVALAAAEDDAPYLVRGAVLDAMVEIRGVDASELLMDALDDADWAVRVRAAEHLDALTPAGGHQDVIRPAPGRNSVRFDDPRLVSPTVSPHVYIETVRGTIELELNVIDAPIAADNFMTLARRGFYDGLTLHRVVPNYVVQGGDPRSDSEGGPGYTLRDELNQVPFMRGTVGMALDWQDTGGSQFFITHSPQPRLDGRYTPFAQVVSGMDVVDRIQRGDLIDRMLVWDGVQPF